MTFKSDRSDAIPEAPSERQSVLILGGFEFVGRHLAESFLKAGWEVTAYTSSRAKPVMHTRMRYLEGDRSNIPFFKASLERLFFDCSIDIFPENPQVTDATVQILFGRTTHHIHLSSDLVYLLTPYLPRPFREDQVTYELGGTIGSHTRWYSKALGLLQAEAVVAKAIKDKGFPATILRISHPSGPHDPSFGDYVHILRILDSQPLVVPVPFGSFRHIYVLDLVEAVLKIALSPHKAVHHTFNLAGSTIVDLEEYLTLLAYALEKTPNLVRIPAEMCAPLLEEGAYPFYYERNLIADTTSIEKQLGIRPRGVERFLGEVVEWYLSSYKGPPPEGYQTLRKREKELLSLGGFK